MKNNVKIEHPYSIRESIVQEENQRESTMFIINLPKSNANIDWIEATWRSDLNKLEGVEMFYSQQLCLEENGSINTISSFETIEEAEQGKFDTVILTSEEDISSLNSRIARMLANEILSNYVSGFKKKIDEYMSKI